RIFAGTYGNELSGLILTGTGNADIKKVKHALKLIRAVRITKKADYRSLIVLKSIFGPYSARIKNPQNMYEWMCRDEKIVEDYLNDPLNNYIYTLNGFFTLLFAVLKMQEEEIIDSTPKDLPILLLSGSEDPVGDYSKKVLQVYDLYKEHGVKDVSINIYDGARHNILQETNKDEVFEDCIKWIMERI
ncbi:alpha/beta hydrolase, partial [uncultured Clostridium sp.]